MAERSKILFRTSLFSAVGHSLVPRCGAYELLQLPIFGWNELINLLLTPQVKSKIPCLIGFNLLNSFLTSQGPNNTRWSKPQSTPDEAPTKHFPHT